MLVRACLCLHTLTRFYSTLHTLSDNNLDLLTFWLNRINPDYPYCYKFKSFAIKKSKRPNQIFSSVFRARRPKGLPRAHTSGAWGSLKVVIKQRYGQAIQTTHTQPKSVCILRYKLTGARKSKWSFGRLGSVHGIWKVRHYRCPIYQKNVYLPAFCTYMYLF